MVIWLCGRSREQVCESRWVHATQELCKVVIACAANDILADALMRWLSAWNVNVGLIGSLERIVSVDAENFAVVNRLKLCRVAMLFNDRRRKLELATMATIVRPVDHV